MIWNSWADFVAMGGYGGYVWAAFGMVLALLGGEAWGLARRERAVRAELRQAAAAGEAR